MFSKVVLDEFLNITEDPFKIFSKNQTVLRKRREEKEVPSQGHSEREYLLKAIYKKDFLEVF